MTATNREIAALRREAASAGDTRLEALCVRALGDALEGAEPGTGGGADARQLSVERAREIVEEALAEARAAACEHGSDPITEWPCLCCGRWH